jgi:hypothetical protein
MIRKLKSGNKRNVINCGKALKSKTVGSSLGKVGIAYLQGLEATLGGAFLV